MADEQLIQQVEAILADLRAGDEAAIDRLAEVVTGDKINVGNISGSTAVAVGSDIRIAIKQHTLPETLVTRLIALADLLDNKAQELFTGKGHITIFLSSPGDVTDERERAIKAIQKLQTDPLYKERLTIEVEAWDKPDDSTPMLASMTPQEAIDLGMLRPSECDIVVVILWSRFGTPLPLDKYQKEDGSQYLSGTEWEFEDAMASAEADGRPYVIVYRRTEEPTISLDDPKLAEKVEQRRRVNTFFDAFTNPDGSIRQGYNAYETPTEFEDIFELHLRKLIVRLLEDDAKPKNSETVGVDSLNIIPPADWPDGVSPFPGLRAFGPADALVYFGRGRETDGLVKRLNNPDTRFLAVVGASGSGKSSLVGAGLIPRLAEGAIEGSADWPVIRFTPDEWGEGDPFDSLAGALIADPLRLDGRGLVRRLRETPTMLREVLEKHLEELSEWAEALLFIDQFEELFTRVDSPEQRNAFVQLLGEAAKSDRVRTVITIRADFYDRVAELPALAALLKQGGNGTYPLAAPQSLDLYEMITGPAQVAGLRFEPGLARQVLTDTGDDPGALALMAYALQQLYEESHAVDGALTWEAYNGFGGVQGAIGQQAQDAFARLDEEAQAALPQVFRELVEVNESGTATRKRAPLELAARDEASLRLVYALTDARLLVTYGGDYPVVEVAHEALFRSWPRLNEWIEEAQDDLILRRQVRTAAQLWEDNNRHPAFLWPEERLEPVWAMVDRLQPQLSELERDFIRSEYDRLLEEIHQPLPDFDTEAEIRAYHRRRAWIGDRLDELGDCQRRAGVGVVTENLPPLTAPKEIRLWGEHPEHLGLPDIVWLPVSGTDGEMAFYDQNGKLYVTSQVSPFYVAKYLITNWQFAAFEQADDGWATPRWWKGLVADDDDRSLREANRPTGNHPRETVSWYEAVAFCAWLSVESGLTGHTLHEWLSAKKSLDTYPGIRLPTEWEWQWAASGEGEGLEYPFGEWDSAKANTRESGLSRTTAVGMYPVGAAKCGALDLSSNVREWCLNESGAPENIDLAAARDSSRALRGGSWGGSLDDARASCRGGYFPLLRFSFSGFRLARSSLSK